MLGKQLDPQTVLSSVALDPYLKFRNGDTLYGRTCDNGGVRCNVSSSDGDLSQEIADAIVFLTKYEADLRKVGSEPDVEKMFLDFGYYLRIDGEQVFFQNDSLPLPLLKLCGSLGIGIYLSLYPPSDEALLVNNSGS